MNILCRSLGFVTMAFAASVAYGEDPAPGATSAGTAESKDQAALEKQFAETMSYAKMTGRFTVTGKDAKDPAPESYSLGKVYKAKGNYWVFETRIQYGKNDITLPLSIPVIWAGNTAVITVDNMPVPPLGTFSARVLVYKDQYAGTWDAGDHGGHLFGTISPGEKPETEKPANDN